MAALATAEEKKEIRKSIDRLVKQSGPKKTITRVKPITTLDKILHCTFGKSTTRYFTTGYPIRHPKLKKFMTPTQSWLDRQNIRERLRVETPEIPEGITDKIPDFYSIIACRPIREKFDKLSFKRQMRARFVNNLQTGLQLDQIKRLEEHNEIAKAVIERAVEESDKAVSGFNQFLLSRMDEDVRSIKEEHKNVKVLNYEKSKALQEATEKMANLKVDMFKFMQAIRETVKCRQFLHNLSNAQWLSDYAILTEKKREENKEVIHGLEENFKNYKQHMSGKSEELENIIAEFLNLYENSGPNKLPFEDPEDLFTAIKKLENDNKDLLVHLKELKQNSRLIEDCEKKLVNHYKKVKKEIDSERVKVRKEMLAIKERKSMIQILANDMTKRLEKSIISREALYERGLVKSLYNEIVKKPRINPTPIEMWEDIESAFMELKMIVDYLPQDELIKRANIIKKRQSMENKLAMKARNRINQVNQMLESLARAYQGPRKNSGKILMPRSQPLPDEERTSTPESPTGIGYSPELERESVLYHPLVSCKTKMKEEASFFETEQLDIFWDSTDIKDNSSSILELPKAPSVLMPEFFQELSQEKTDK